MKIKDFITKYNLHDSFFKTVVYDEANSSLFLEIEFAFWMQANYVEGSPEEGILQATFHEVSFYSCPDGNPLGDFSGILNATIEDEKTCKISMLDDVENSYFEMLITANDVTVNEIR